VSEADVVPRFERHRLPAIALSPDKAGGLGKGILGKGISRRRKCDVVEVSGISTNPRIGGPSRVSAYLLSDLIKVISALDLTKAARAM
jgi:hypothetical protein